MTRGRRYSWYRDDPAAATPPSDPTPRSALFRLAAALAIHDYAAPGLDRDTRPGDAIAPALYYPAACEVCGQPPQPGTLYCSAAHRKIVEGETR